MYEQHFGFRCRPFRNNADTRFFFAGGERGAVVASLRYAIASGEGMIKVVGEVGSGKTVISRTLAIQVSALADLVYLPNPSLTPDEVIRSIALELKLPVTDDAPPLQVQYLLQNHLLSLHGSGRHVVILVEEAQAMPRETLECVRLLSNLETEREKLVQIILFGQPELDKVLARNDLRQLRERISHAFYLEPLSLSDVRDYLNHRLHIAGYNGTRLFPDDVVAQIGRGARGSIRRINQIADKTLLAAFADGAARVSRKHSTQALADVICRNSFSKVRTQWPAITSAAAACALAIAVLSFSGGQNVALAKLGETPVAPVETAPISNEVTAQVPVPTPAPTTNNLTADNKNWAEKSNLDQFTILLITSHGENPVGFEKFEQLFKRQEFSSLAHKVRVYSGFDGARKIRVAAFDAYKKLADAKAAIESLPEELTRHKPYVVRLRTIVNRYGQAQTDKGLSVTSLAE